MRVGSDRQRFEAVDDFRRRCRSSIRRSRPPTVSSSRRRALCRDGDTGPANQRPGQLGQPADRGPSGHAVDYRTGLVDHFTIDFPQGTVAGVAFQVTVTARDQAGNVMAPTTAVRSTWRPATEKARCPRARPSPPEWRRSRPRCGRPDRRRSRPRTPRSPPSPRGHGHGQPRGGGPTGLRAAADRHNRRRSVPAGRPRGRPRRLQQRGDQQQHRCHPHPVAEQPRRRNAHRDRHRPARQWRRRVPDRSGSARPAPASRSRHRPRCIPATVSDPFERVGGRPLRGDGQPADRDGRDQIHGHGPGTQRPRPGRDRLRRQGPFHASDPQAVLPPDSTLTNGEATFPVTLRTAGPRTIAVADLGKPTVRGALAKPVTVTPAAVTALRTTGLVEPSRDRQEAALDHRGRRCVRQHQPRLSRYRSR